MAESSMGPLARWSRWIFDPGGGSDAGLLVLRLGIGGLMASLHGWGKLLSFPEKAATWADPIGVGSELSLALAISAELGCALLIVIGLGTRGAALPLAFTMLVAALVVHAADPLATKEKALLFLIPCVTLALTGAGRWSVDGWLARRRARRQASP